MIIWYSYYSLEISACYIDDLAYVVFLWEIVLFCFCFLAEFCYAYCTFPFHIYIASWLLFIFISISRYRFRSFLSPNGVKKSFYSFEWSGFFIFLSKLFTLISRESSEEGCSFLGVLRYCLLYSDSLYFFSVIFRLSYLEWELFFLEDTWGLADKNM